MTDLTGRARRVVTQLRNMWPRTMRTGVGAGLRFVVGRTNPAYGTGENELPVQMALAGLIRPGMVFYDVGANAGFFSVLAGRMVGSRGMVVAFEPVPGNAALVRRNAHLNRMTWITVLQSAVAATSGSEELVLAAYAGGGALESAGLPPDAVGRITVATIALDDLVAGGSVPPPSVVKVDVEGAEQDVLLGMRAVLAEHRPSLVLEFDGPTVEDVERKLVACKEILQEFGYAVEPLPDSYAITWIVRHVVAQPT